jgi:hypothetical protein
VPPDPTGAANQAFPADAISATMRSVQVTARHGHSWAYRKRSLYLDVCRSREAGA